MKVTTPGRHVPRPPVWYSPDFASPEQDTTLVSDVLVENERQVKNNAIGSKSFIDGPTAALTVGKGFGSKHLSDERTFSTHDDKPVTGEQLKEHWTVYLVKSPRTTVK